MFDPKKPTSFMLGRFQPFHNGHFALFKEALAKTGQVLIAVRDTGGTDEKNPFDFEFVKSKIEEKLGYYSDKYQIILIPNITSICYGRSVGYSIDKIDLPADIEAISATEIRKQMKS